MLRNVSLERRLHLGMFMYLLQYLLKCALHLSSLKCYYSQRNSVGTDKENIVPGYLRII